MTPLERSALTAAFLAATVAAGLALSTVPHVELVTLVVFSSGILLGSARGALVGGVGMTLYVFANSAVKGFPPSPLPLLVAQAAGMVLPGLAGGWWRAGWLRGGTPRRSAYFFLPVLGVLLSALYQAITNGVFALFLSDASGPRRAVFLSGMAFGLLDMLTNGIAFALAGPRVASVLRRIARDRGWWGRAVVLSVLLLPGLVPVRAVFASAEADTSTAVVGTTGVPKEESAGADTAGVVPGKAEVSQPLTPPSPRMSRGALRRLETLPQPLWIPVSPRRVVEWGVPSLALSDSLYGRERSQVASPGLPPTLDSWALGWGRTSWSVDGLPLSGPVHGFDEPPDLPLAWRGLWAERWTAAGTEFGLAPLPVLGPPASQITITTGGYGRRTTEFGLFRTLGSVQVGADFLDRIEEGRQDLLAVGLSDLQDLAHNRLWLRLAQVPGRRPDWSLDLSTASEERNLADGSTLERAIRRVQGSLRGPFLGGESRVGTQFRRQALRLDKGPSPFGEVLFDGFTVQADWAAPGLPGLSTRLRWDRDRRRGILDPRTFDGVSGAVAWARSGAVWMGGAEAVLGQQDPYGFTWKGRLNGERRLGALDLRASVAHEEDLPGLVVGLDRPSPEEGMEEHLQVFESVLEPEERTAVRVEAGWNQAPIALQVGGWAARIRNYRVESNPLWSFTSVYAPFPTPSSTGDVVGGYGRLDLAFSREFHGDGRIRVQSRPAAEVPYLARWTADGAIHWKRLLFHESLDLDLSLAGQAIGPRRTPDGETYPMAGTNSVRLNGRIDNGVVTMALENVLDAYIESDLRGPDFVTPLPAQGRTFTIGLTFYLSQ